MDDEQRAQTVFDHDWDALNRKQISDVANGTNDQALGRGQPSPSCPCGHVMRARLKGQEEERRHIARELHDEIGQTLTAVKLNLQAMLSQFDVLGAPIQESLNLVEQALHEVRNLSQGLRPLPLDEQGFIPALRKQLEQQAQRGGFRFDLAVDQGAPDLDPSIENTFFRIVQEALTNILRHAWARHVTIALWQESDTLYLLIRDDGVGFDMQATDASGLGLGGIAERTRLIGGHLHISTAPGQGTSLRVAVPLPDPDMVYDGAVTEPCLTIF